MYWSPEVIPPNPTEIVNTVPIQHPKPLALPHESKAIEATSYALMVYLMNNWYAESVPIMNWLQTRRSSHSGFDGVRVRGIFECRTVSLWGCLATSLLSFFASSSFAALSLGNPRDSSKEDTIITRQSMRLLDTKQQ